MPLPTFTTIISVVQTWLRNRAAALSGKAVSLMFLLVLAIRVGHRFEVGRYAVVLGVVPPTSASITFRRGNLPSSL
jgi:hypothetical protein